MQETDYRIVNNRNAARRRTAMAEVLVKTERQKAEAEGRFKDDAQRRTEAVARMIEAKVDLALRLLRY